MLRSDWKKTLLPIKSVIRDAIQNLEKSSMQIILVVDKKQKFLGTITDGDIRRGILYGLNIHSSIKTLINKKPIVVLNSANLSQMNQIIQRKKIHHLPIVDKNKKLVGLYIEEPLNIRTANTTQIIIMAGGRGKRLLPHTKIRPKPMLSIAGKPILEHILIKAKLEGFNNFIFSINYLGHMIKNFFGNGSKWDVKIKYLQESKPLGTAGSLSLLKNSSTLPFIVCNGDVISDIKFLDMLDFHIRNKALGTVAVKPYEIKNPYGVVKVNGNKIINIDEKPIIKSHVNTGVYVFSSKILKDLKKNNYLDMNILIQKQLKNKKKIIAYPAYEPWLDIGKPKDLKKAKKK